MYGFLNCKKKIATGEIANDNMKDKIWRKKEKFLEIYFWKTYGGENKIKLLGLNYAASIETD